MSGDALRIANARTLLGVPGPLTPQALSAAFRVAVKAARPDIPGGDVEQFRRVIDAYHLLQSQPLALPAPEPAQVFVAPPPPAIMLVLTPQQALAGGSVCQTIHGRKLQIKLPPGLRSSDRVRLKAVSPSGDDQLVPVLVRPADGLTTLGSDLFMDWPVSDRLIRDGGRITVETHAGQRHAWLVPDMAEPVRLRFKGLGLPARGAHSAGDLFVRLIATSDAPSAAEDMLLRFTQVWTSKPLAA